jgi:uroporphyrinogen decarboxylase
VSASAFVSALERRNAGRPPVWFMRQAGRYHSHYQRLKARHSFIDLCRVPELACEVALGPIEDFDFDAAILFSDLLFPLEAMGMPLEYAPGPKLGWHVRSLGDVARLKSGAELAAELDFQAEALRRTRARLAPTKGLLGFVGGPLTLYCYAAVGSHQHDLGLARSGVAEGVFAAFCDRLRSLLAANLVAQAEADADVVAILDTCAGEFTAAEFGRHVVPELGKLLEEARERGLRKPVLYYSKGTSPEYWDLLGDLPIQGLGIDWRSPVADALRRYGDRWAIQGNFDPERLRDGGEELDAELRAFFEPVAALPAALRRGWICGLGHGVLQATPEANVRRFIELEREYF